jgi:hypothetical protein
LAGVVIPIASFIVAWFGCPLSPTWQDNSGYDLIVLQLEGKVTWPFFPVLAYSICCLVLATIAPSRFGSRRLVRLGIHSGIILAAQYTIIMGIALSPDAVGFLIAIGVAGVVPVGLVIGFRALVRHLRPRLLWMIVVIMAVGGVITSQLFRIHWRSLAEAFYFIVGAGPLWALVAYSYMSSKVLRSGPEMTDDEHKFAAAWPFCWFAGYLLTWRLAIYTAAKFYHALPTAAPGCYVCTAAARGHARFVGARAIRCGDGSVVRVNDQLRHLKLAELALIAVLPRVHRLLRRIYDRIGPVAAARLRHPFAADLAYLSLKPIEWISLAALCLIIKDPARVAESMLYLHAHDATVH